VLCILGFVIEALSARRSGGPYPIFRNFAAILNPAASSPNAKSATAVLGYSTTSLRLSWKTCPTPKSLVFQWNNSVRKKKVRAGRTCRYYAPSPSLPGLFFVQRYLLPFSLSPAIPCALIVRITRLPQLFFVRSPARW